MGQFHLFEIDGLLRFTGDVFPEQDQISVCRNAHTLGYRQCFFRAVDMQLKTANNAHPVQENTR